MPTKMVICNKKDTITSVEDVEKWEPSYTFVGNVKLYIAALECSLAVPHKVRHRVTI